jgi:dihydrofolate reductase
MKKLIVQEWISLDGYATDKDSKLDFFAPSVRETYSDDYFKSFLNDIDCILMGRKTYEQFAAVWAGRPIEGDLLARVMNTAQKIVFSKTLSRAPWGEWKEATIETEDPVARIKKLKQVDGKNIMLWASLSLAALLIRENLVDEYRMFICPTITGGGRKFPSEGSNRATLKLIDSKHFNNGVVSTSYKVQ